MKTTIEINGFKIVISDETEGTVVVSAIKEDETIEEFTLETEDAQAQGQNIQDFAQEAQDFPQASQEVQDQAQGLQSQAQDIQTEDEIKLESFESFLEKRNK